MEVLEGVLSETMLDELASDLGIDPKDLRKHPFFRVLKGRVLLTYPLKSYNQCFEFQTPAALEQVDPVNGQFYPVLSKSENVRLLFIVMKHDNAVAANMYAQVDIDGQTFTSADAGRAAADTVFVTQGATETGALTLVYGTTQRMVGTNGPIEGRDVAVKVKTTTDFGGGKKMWCAVYYEKV